MARYVNLTLPLYDFMPVGNVWAWDVPFQSRPITTVERNGFELSMITMHSETGTRLMIPRMQDPNAPTVDQVDLEDLVMRDLHVADLPSAAEEEIGGEQMRRCLAELDGFARGAALLVRTGWGDGRRWESLGDDYARNTPHFSPDAAEAVCDWLLERGSNLILSDVAYYGRGEKHMLPDWANRPAWEREPFPSIAAQRFLATYDRRKSEEDWDSPPVFNRKGVMYVGACCDCGQIRERTLKVIVLPMRLQGFAGASCTVVAVQGYGD